MIKTIRTLIVEDNDTFRQALKNLLHSRFSFMTFAESRDGQGALEKLKDFGPDLIFMDIKLPGENGLDVTKKMRHCQCRAVIIVLTSYDLPEYREAATQCGANHFVSKGSSTAQDILNLVESILSKLPKSNMVDAQGEEE